MNGSKLYLKKHVKKIKGQRRKQLNSRLLFKRFMECFKKWMYEWPFIKRQTSGLSSDNEWQRMTANDNEWQGTVQRVTTSGTTSDNEWQQVATNDSKWQRVVHRVTTSDKEWQRMAMSDSEWEQWYSEWKWHSTLQRMIDCHHFNDKKRYTTTSRDVWLQLEWLDK